MLLEIMTSAALVQSAGAREPDPGPDPLSLCEVPRPRRTDRFVVFNAYEGGATSNVAVAGLDKPTSTGKITIGRGKQPIFLVLFSFEPVLFRIEGAVGRLSKVVVVHPEGGGVTGVPRAKIKFSIGETCRFPYFGSTLVQTDPRIVLKSRFGRLPDILEGAEEGDFNRAWTDGRTFRSEPDPHKWIDGQTPLDRVVRIDPRFVVSSQSAVRYSTLPGAAGAQQLEQSGAIVRASREEVDEWKAKAAARYGEERIKHFDLNITYRVLRPVDLPAGCLLVTYLAPSADYISGNPCHSSIVLSDGRILKWAGHLIPPELKQDETSY